MSRLSAVELPDVRVAIVIEIERGEGELAIGDGYEIVPSRGSLSKAFGWRPAVSDTDKRNANPDRYESLIHLRFWKVQSTTIQACPVFFFFPGQLTLVLL